MVGFVTTRMHAQTSVAIQRLLPGQVYGWAEGRVRQGSLDIAVQLSGRQDTARRTVP